MGMFDYIDYETVCPICHEKIEEFQSKCHDCQLKTLHPHEVMNFYRSCNKCGCWVEFERAGKTFKYNRIVTGKNNKILHEKTILIKPKH